MFSRAKFHIIKVLRDMRDRIFEIKNSSSQTFINYRQMKFMNRAKPLMKVNIIFVICKQNLILNPRQYDNLIRAVYFNDTKFF